MHADTQQRRELRGKWHTILLPVFSAYLHILYMYIFYASIQSIDWTNTCAVSECRHVYVCRMRDTEKNVHSKQFTFCHVLKVPIKHFLC